MAACKYGYSPAVFQWLCDRLHKQPTLSGPWQSLSHRSVLCPDISRTSLDTRVETDSSLHLASECISSSHVWSGFTSCSHLI